MKKENAILYWDSSALIKHYITEPFSDWVGGKIAEHRTHYTSVLTHAEIMATLFRLRRDSLIRQTQLEAVLERFRGDWSRMVTISYNEAVQNVAAQAIEKASLRGADLVHLASALILSQEGLAVAVVTFDDKLRTAAADQGLDEARPPSD